MKNLKYLILMILLVSFAGLYGCYTQVATSDGRYSKRYHERDYEDSYGQRDSSLYGYDNQDNDTSYYPGGATINNYYLYGDYYRPFYRRYYWGYHPGINIGISWGWNDPWNDPWAWSGWYDNYYDPFYSPYYNYPYFYPPYYGSYWGSGYGHYYGWGNWGSYKYRTGSYPKSRFNEGGRSTVGLRNRDLISPTRNTTGRSLFKTRTQTDTRNIAPGTRNGEVRSREQQRSTTLRKGNSNAPDNQQKPVYRRDRQRTNSGSYNRPRNEGNRNTEQRREGNNRGNSERRRSNYYNYYWPDQQRGGNHAPQYNPPTQQQYNPPRRESRDNGTRNYNPPQSRGDNGSRGGNPPQSRNSGSRNSGGNDNGRRR
ncbi:MAG: hypothetical protein ACM3P0_12455 [Acidobacteriota bacterium]